MTQKAKVKRVIDELYAMTNKGLGVNITSLSVDTGFAFVKNPKRIRVTIEVK